jgi:hypothetical protein
MPRGPLKQQRCNYLGRYGHRPICYDSGGVTLAEGPGLLTGLLRDHVDGPAGFRLKAIGGDDVLTEACGRLAMASLADRDRFETALPFASRACPVRDENAVLDNLPSGLIRGAVAEIGRRLADRRTVARRRPAP